MWQKFKEQLPAVIITAVLVIAAAAIMVQSIARRQQAEIAPLRVQNENLAAQAEENRRQIAATTKMLRDALAQNGGSFQAEANVEKLNDERLTRLAEVIAKRVIPAIPAPKTPSELEAAENEQVDKVAGRLAENIKPVLAGAIAEQQAANAMLGKESERRINQLNVGLLATQAAAQDALKLSREIQALYSDSAKDEGVLVRLFSLPAGLVMDAARMDFVGSERARVQRELAVKSAEIEKRLAEVRALASDSGASTGVAGGTGKGNGI
ncbi:MAG: hypothetical protein V4773_16375 [Verrucomicrobiota bacterium]